MCDAQIGVMELERELETARGGMYGRAVQAAIVCGDKESFFTVCEKLMADFRNNARGIGEKYAEKGLVAQAKDKAGKLRWHDDAQTEPVYTVPSSLSTAKSVLGKALDRGIDLGTEKEPESFSAIREANKAEKGAEERAAMSPAEKKAHELAETLRGIAETVETAELKTATVNALQKLANTLGKTLADAIEKAA
jgi:hypothetical protein